jgi:hypothetical protein
MVISREREAEILRYYHVEKWRVGTIAREIGVHHNVVKRVLAQGGLHRFGKPRASQIDPFLPFIHQTLEKFPALTASRLYAMVRERGYRGGPDHSAILSPATGHAPQPKPICVSAACRPRRRKLIGVTSVIC